ncbi:MAG TPA: hypothetical protein VFT99_07495, partial [Roseiflexaceae bacterium]|nr:hypothetical protein [Roseiflexaceae bacterium]
MTHSERNQHEQLQAWLAAHSETERSVIAQLWGLAADRHRSPAAMAQAMLQPERVRALVASLGAQEQAALRLVQSYGGSIPAGTLERQYGTIRTTDAYPNARVYLLALEYPPSPVERLSILGLIQLERAGTDRLYSLAPDVAALLPPES